MHTKPAPFRSFHHKFQVARTLRFELRPYDQATRDRLNWGAPTLEETFFGEEAKRNEARPYLKELWSDEIFAFTQRALSAFRFTDDELTQAFRLLQAMRQDRTLAEDAGKAFDDYIAQLGKRLAAHIKKYQENIPEMGKSLTAETIRKGDVYPLLQQRAKEKGGPYPDAVARFKGLFSKLQDLVRNRAHLLEYSRKKGQLVTRVAEENLRRFLANCLVLEQIDRAGIELSPEEREALLPTSYNKFLTQVGVDAYNRIIGGEAAGVYEERQEGINNKINRYNQQARTSGAPLITPLLPLYRLPGAPRGAKVEVLETDEQLLAHLRKTLEEGKRFREATHDFFSWFFDALAQTAQGTSSAPEVDVYRVFLRPQGVRRIAQEIVSEWAAFQEVVNEHKKAKAVPLGAILAFIEGHEDAFRLLKGADRLTPQTFLELWRANTMARIEGGEVKSAASERAKRVFAPLVEVEERFRAALEEFERHYSANTSRPPAERWSAMKRIWREYLEAIDEVGRLLSDFLPPEDQIARGADPAFLERWVPVYALRTDVRPAHLLNLARNYLTKREKHPAQLRIFFQPNFLDNWSWTKIQSSCALLGLDPQGSPVLFVFANGNAARAFQRAVGAKKKDEGGEQWIVFVFQQAKVDKLIPTLVRTPEGVKRVTGRKDPDGVNRQKDQALRKYLPPKIYALQKEFGFGKNNTRSAMGDEDFDAFLAYYQQCAVEYLADPSHGGFTPTFRSRYESWQEFIEDLDRQTTRWQRTTVDKATIERLEQEGDVLLFRVCNKDLCSQRHPHSHKNVHTIILEALLSEENTQVQPPLIRIGSEAKIFYRPAQKGEGEPKEVGGNSLSRLTPEGEEEQVMVHHRYHQPKLLFHLPLFVNNDCPALKSFTALNEMVNEELLTPSQTIIGVDRGERNLLAYALIDEEDRLLSAGSLNEINGTNYQALLKQRERERQHARQEWEEVGNITNLKSGYLSQVIHFLVAQSLDNDAAIALEGLAFRFQQKRGGQFERSVYLQFENALLNKLELVVEKSKQDEPFRAVREAPQLATVTKKTERNDYRGQDGVVFFVPAEYTSQTCPHCGYRSERSFNYTNKEGARKLIADRLRFIRFVPGEGYRIVLRREDDGSDLELRASVTRARWDPVSRQPIVLQPEDLTKAFRAILGAGASEGELVGFSSVVQGFGLNPDAAEVSADELANAEADATTYKALFYFLNRVIQPRSSIENNGDNANMEETTEKSGAKSGDFFLCPRCGFDTRNAAAYAHHPEPSVRHLALITDGDIVGAYNIARKGRLEILRALDKDRQKGKRRSQSSHRHIWDQYVYRKSPIMLWEND